MAIKPAPKWAKGAVPTEKGWVRNGEILIARKHSKADLKAWEEANSPKPKKAKKKKTTRKKKVNEAKVKDDKVMLTESPVGKSLDDMNETEKKLVEEHFGSSEKVKELNEESKDDE